MVENLVKPITESLQILRGSLQPTQADISMDTNVTPEEVRSPIVKDTTTQVIDEYMDQECRKCSIIIHSMQEKPSQYHKKVGLLLESKYDANTFTTQLGKSPGNKTRLIL